MGLAILLIGFLIGMGLMFFVLGRCGWIMNISRWRRHDFAEFDLEENSNDSFGRLSNWLDKTDQSFRASIL